VPSKHCELLAQWVSHHTRPESLAALLWRPQIWQWTCVTSYYVLCNTTGYIMTHNFTLNITHTGHQTLLYAVMFMWHTVSERITCNTRTTTERYTVNICRNMSPSRQQQSLRWYPITVNKKLVAVLCVKNEFKVDAVQPQTSPGIIYRKYQN